MLLFVASSMAQKIQWEKFTSNKGKFSVTLPGKPEISSTDLESGGSVHKISVKVGDGVCFASYTELEYSEGDQQELAQIGLQAFVNQLGADLNDAAVWKVGKEKGRMATMKNHEQGLEAYYRTVIVGNFMYQIAVAYGNDVPVDKKVAKKFLNSFKLLK